MTTTADGRPWAPLALVRGSHGAVVAPHHLASAAGLSILRAGGTAVDAAIATNAALAVVKPDACGIGGDAFWLTWDAAAGRQTALNGSGRAGSRADAGFLLASGLTDMPFRGPHSITVPGAVRSWGDQHRERGRLTRDAILAPAIELARDGFPAWDGFIRAVESTAPIAAALGQGSGGAGFAAVYRPHGRPWRAGERVRLPALAATLETLARDGFDAYYEGDLGDRLARFLDDIGASISRADLAGHRSTPTTPIEIAYRGVRVTSHPPNSSGLVALELIGLLERFEPPAPAAFGPNGPTDPSWIHLGIEAAKLAMADRDAFLSDPATTGDIVPTLLDPARLDELAARIDLGRAAVAPTPTRRAGGGTIYLATVDGEGNAVSLIESNYAGFGSGVVDAGTGIHYQNRGSYFSLADGHPNRLEPGKRTLHTLLPGMLFRDGQGDPPGPWLVAGSMGGDAQPQIHAQLVSALVDGGVDIATAVGGPRWFVEPDGHFAPPIEVRLEPRFADGVADALADMGHPITFVEPFDGLMGHEHAIELVDGGPSAPEGSLAAVTDPRSPGLPAVW